jgi:hypothetical protein
MHPIEPEELMAYLDGELMPQRASEAAHHLSHCRECQSAAAEMQSVSRRLFDWQIEEPGPRVEHAINSARLPERPRPAWRRGVLWIAGLAAACIVLLMVVPRPQLQMARLISTGREARMMQDEQGWQGTRLRATFEPLPQSALQNPSPSVARDRVLPRAGDPLVIRTAQITLTTPDFAKARASVEEILKRLGGHIGNLSIGSPADSGQSFQATLRVPVDRLDAAMAEIRHLGRVETEQQGGEEVTRQMVDLDARLANGRNTEQRLADILRRSTGKITDVLAVEKEIDRVRGDIERMEADHKNLDDRVNFATLDVRINEEYKAHLAVSAPSTPGRLRNSAVEGYKNVADSLTGIAMFVLSYGPALVLWAALLFFPARYARRRLWKSGPQKPEKLR